jgi:hypothetical protein
MRRLRFLRLQPVNLDLLRRGDADANAMPPIDGANRDHDILANQDLLADLPGQN